MRLDPSIEIDSEEIINAWFEEIEFLLVLRRGPSALDPRVQPSVMIPVSL